jgi:hypothetical protein
MTSREPTSANSPSSLAVLSQDFELGQLSQEIGRSLRRDRV